MQANKDILLNTMDVFVKEPLLDWQKLAQRLAKEQGITRRTPPHTYLLFFKEKERETRDSGSHTKK